MKFWPSSLISLLLLSHAALAIDLPKITDEVLKEAQRRVSVCQKIGADLQALPTQQDQAVTFIKIPQEQMTLHLDNLSALLLQNQAEVEYRTWFAKLTPAEQLKNFGEYLKLTQLAQATCIQNSVSLIRGLARQWNTYDAPTKKIVFDRGTNFFKTIVPASGTLLEISTINSELGLLIKANAWGFKKRGEKAYWGWFKSTTAELKKFVASQDLKKTSGNPDPTKWTEEEKKMRLQMWNVEHKLAKRVATELKAYIADLKPIT